MTATYPEAELRRLRESYEARDAAMPPQAWKRNPYHPRHPLGRLFEEHHHQALVAVLNALDLEPEGLRVLDVGCGWGAWLRYLVELGARPERLTGIDLSHQRIAAARAMHPGIHWIHGADGLLPLPDASFDLVLQVVVFSSILDAAARAALAREMLRVTRPGGHILWIDHRRRTNDRLEGFSRERVQAYFPAARLVYADAVHPRHFRRLYRRHAWLARLLYGLTRWSCDSSLLVFRVGPEGSAHA